MSIQQLRDRYLNLARDSCIDGSADQHANRLRTPAPRVHQSRRCAIAPNSCAKPPPLQRPASCIGTPRLKTSRWWSALPTEIAAGSSSGAPSYPGDLKAHHEQQRPPPSRPGHLALPAQRPGTTQATWHVWAFTGECQQKGNWAGIGLGGPAGRGRQASWHKRKAIPDQRARAPRLSATRT